jgi:hypothetical protein
MPVCRLPEYSRTFAYILLLSTILVPESSDAFDAAACVGHVGVAHTRTKDTQTQNGSKSPVSCLSYTMAYGVYILFSVLFAVLVPVCYATYHVVIAPYFSPLRNLPGPPAEGWLGTHMHLLLNSDRSARETEKMVKQYGRNFRIQGLGRVRLSLTIHCGCAVRRPLHLPYYMYAQHDERLMTVDPVAVSHVLNRSTVYEKPWQSRRLITRLIGEGMLGAEGNVHKRQASRP